jgi:hypothetical protein
MVHAALDRWLSGEAVGEFDGRFAIPMGGNAGGLGPRDVAVLGRLTAPMPVAQVLTSRLEVAALERLVARLAVASVAVLVLASAWVAVDPQDRYNAEHRQLGLQGLGGVAAALVGAVAGYLARSKP